MAHIVYWDGGGIDVWFLPTEFKNGGYTQDRAAARRFDSKADALSYLQSHDYGGGWMVAEITEDPNFQIAGFAPQMSQDLWFRTSSGIFGGRYINMRQDKLPANATVYCSLNWSGKLIVRTGGIPRFTYPIAKVETNADKIVSVEDLRPNSFQFT